MIGMRRVNSTVFRLLLAAFLAIFSTAALAQRLEDLPAATDYVSDNAHVLSPEAIARLDHLCSQLDHSQANAQIAVVTVRNLDGDDSADYATRLFEKMKIGAKGTDRGLLFLFAIDDRRRSIKVGYGLEGILPDGKTGDIGRSMVPYLQRGDYDNAALLGVSQAANVIATDAKITLDDDTGLVRRQPVRQAPALGKVILLVILFIFFGGFMLLRFLLNLGLFGGWGGWGGRGPWIGGGGFGGGGGGFGGGDSGGFGGFGGGGTGGGGSDGGW
jgi:uncharacterized protein